MTVITLLTEDVAHCRPLSSYSGEDAQEYPSTCQFVQLHVHLDGSVRPATLFELAQKKGFPLKQRSAKELAHYLHGNISTPGVQNFFKAFQIILPVLRGDAAAIYRVTMEFLEDAAKQKQCYVEMRFSSYFFKGPNFKTGAMLSEDDVIQTVLKASKDGQKMYRVKSNIILCAIRQAPNKTANVVDLAVKYRTQGVVGIDIAGAEDEKAIQDGTPPILIKAFHRARQLGVPYTIHAGEDHLHRTKLIGEAILTLDAKRLGHGYAVVHNATLYQILKEKRVHVEVCPMSSYLTGAVPATVTANHPLKRFANDNVSFSLSTDDMTITNTSIPIEVYIAGKIVGINEMQTIKAQMNAATASFLTDGEKALLLNHLRKVYNN